MHVKILDIIIETASTNTIYVSLANLYTNTYNR